MSNALLFFIFSNIIRDDELRSFFRLEASPLNKKMFQLFGSSGYLDFLEFVCSVSKRSYTVTLYFMFL
jgi:hypothetical protein